jgi:iron complex transport system substrate-binding protein
MTSLQPRIISLIPSATEILASLGLAQYLVGRSHECDYPSSVQALPICTAPNLDPKADSQTIHARVSELLQKSLSIYRIDLAQLEMLQPTHVITQAQCDVCAVSLGELETAMTYGRSENIAQLTQAQPTIISLQPQTLTDIWSDFQRVGDALGVSATPIIAQLQARMAAVVEAVQDCPRPWVVCIEWTEPLMAAGNWVPELVQLAGGDNQIGNPGKHSPWMTWEELQSVDPDVLVVMPCGFDLEHTRKAAIALTTHPNWAGLTAVKTGQVYLVDGNQYFNRPGPRLVDSLEILAEILHPQKFKTQYHSQGWQRFVNSLD